ncbi:hypothetical protein TNCV_2228301 [Trichonephila clavipes]|nr:hypothetical protein TNCV_2228301 [Trichonephila clavipes]
MAMQHRKPCFNLGREEKKGFMVLDWFLGGRFFLRGFEVRVVSWDIVGMVLDVVVVVSRTDHAVDEEDAAEIDKLLEVVGAVSITE